MVRFLTRETSSTNRKLFSKGIQERIRQVILKIFKTSKSQDQICLSQCCSDCGSKNT